MVKFNQQKLNRLKKIDRILRIVYFFCKERHYPPIIKEATNEIVVLGMLLIGDTIMCIPALKVLRKNFQGARITLVCEKAVKAILENQGLIDSFIIVRCPWMNFDYSLKSIADFFGRKLRTINQTRFDLAIDFRGDWRNIFFMNFIHARRKVGINHTGGEYMLTDVIVLDKSIEHYIEESLFLLKQIGCDYDKGDRYPVLNLTKDVDKYLIEFKATNKLEGKFIIGVHPGASQEVKRWDEEKFCETIIRLSNICTDSAFILFEGPNERSTVSKIERILLSNGIKYTIVNKPLEEYIVLLSICQLVICNDSGAAHIAGAFSIPTVVVFGNVDPAYAGPYNTRPVKIISHKMECKPCHQAYCKFATNACISGITVDEVYDNIEQIVNDLQKAYT